MKTKTGAFSLLGTLVDRKALSLQKWRCKMEIAIATPPPSKYPYKLRKSGFRRRYGFLAQYIVTRAVFRYR